ncbi:MAG: hypothetical protein IKK57_03795 [Clostridia bacterium]|nr:hypothetical protein [Clostridia bacterium]
MKKGRIWLVLAVLFLLSMGGGLLCVSLSPVAHTIFELQQLQEILAEGEMPDLSGVMEILADLAPEKQLRALQWNILSGEDEKAARERSLLTATVAVRMYASGDMNREVASDVVAEALRLWPVSDAWPEAIRAELPGMLACLDEAQLLEVLKAADIAASGEIQRTLGDILAQQPLSVVAEVAAARWEAGLEGDTLVRRALASYTQEEIVAVLAAETDEVRRNALARAYGLTLNAVDDVLCYLAEARAVGIPAQACYPDGAVVTWDLSRLGRNGWPSLQLAEGARYLVVRVEEAEEAFEWRDVPLEMDLEDESAYEGMFSTYYESNAGRWMETVTVTIDTAVMDATPEAFLPSDLSELDAMVVLETRYVAWGSLRVQYGVRKGRNALSKETFRDYRCYGAEQTVNVYTGSGRLIFRVDSLETAPGAINGRTDGFSDNYSETNLRLRCHAQPDAAWMQDCCTRLLTLLQENGGDLGKAIRIK